MDVSFLDLREKEVVNVFNGKRLGRIIDLVFDVSSGEVLGLIVPGDKKIFHKGDDFFISLTKIKRIGSDVILVGVQTDETFISGKQRGDLLKKRGNLENYYNSGLIGNKSSENFSKQKFNAGSSGMVQNFEDFNENTQKYAVSDAVVGQRNGFDTNKRNKTYTFGQSQSNNSYVRLRPLERKKYK